jgi:hypothetical protein
VLVNSLEAERAASYRDAPSSMYMITSYTILLNCRPRLKRDERRKASENRMAKGEVYVSNNLRYAQLYAISNTSISLSRSPLSSYSC